MPNYSPMNATIGNMPKRKKRMGPLARRELLYDFVEVLTMWCTCGAVLIAGYLRGMWWGWWG